MCTVTFLPDQDRITITSNRDEKWVRGPGLYPAVHRLTTGLALLPKDAALGGTWFAIHQHGHAMVLLNGGWTKHKPKQTGTYRKSRGLVLLDWIDHLDPVERFRTIDLRDIEPFTTILFTVQGLHACRWDGGAKSIEHIDQQAAHLWSSATLYDASRSAVRRLRFNQWLHHHPKPSQEDILDFHRGVRFEDSGADQPGAGDNRVATVSITSLALTQGLASMTFIDLVTQHRVASELPLLNPIPAT